MSDETGGVSAAENWGVGDRKLRELVAGLLNLGVEVSEEAGRVLRRVRFDPPPKNKPKKALQLEIECNHMPGASRVGVRVLLHESLA